MTGLAVVVGYALRESLRRRVFLVVCLLTAAFLGLYALGVKEAFDIVEREADEGLAPVDERELTGATMFGLSLFATLFLGPFALFVAVVVLIFVMAILGGAVLPAVRWMQLPDWFATGGVAAAVGVVAWLQSDLWLPRSLWFLSLLARAWKIVLA